MQLTLDVPESDFLLTWAAATHQRLPADAVLHNAASGPALETLRLPAAYCVSYREALASGDAASGAYLCPLVLSDPHWLDLTGQRAGRGLAWHRRRKAPAKSHQAAGWLAWGWSTRFVGQGPYRCREPAGTE